MCVCVCVCERVDNGHLSLHHSLNVIKEVFSHDKCSFFVTSRQAKLKLRLHEYGQSIELQTVSNRLRVMYIWVCAICINYGYNKNFRTYATKTVSL